MKPKRIIENILGNHLLRTPLVAFGMLLVLSAGSLTKTLFCLP